MTVRFEPLTLWHILCYYGVEQPYPMRGYAMIRDDKIAGIFGIYQDQGLDIAFCNINEEIRQRRGDRWFKRMMLSGMWLILELKNDEQPLYVYADEIEPDAEGYLEHFGFERLKGRAYIWH